MNQAVLLVHLSNPFQVMLLDCQLTQLTKYHLFKLTVSLDKPTVSLFHSHCSSDTVCFASDTAGLPSDKPT